MSVEAIPEHANSPHNYYKVRCPSLYSIVQFTCSLASCIVLVVCFSSTLWVETFIDSPPSHYRYLSVGLWKVCYYEDVHAAATATRCDKVKFKDFTLPVQICQCLAVAASCIAVMLCLIRVFYKICCCCNITVEEDRMSYEMRKYRIVCHLIAILGIGISIPLYMCEANIEGVELVNSNINTATADKESTQKVSETLPTNSTAPVGLTIPVNNATTTPEMLGNHSVFALALWMQFVSFGLACLAFTLALIKHSRKRKERLAAPYTLPRRKSRPALTIELKSRPRSESQRAFFSRQSSSGALTVGSQDVPVSP